MGDKHNILYQKESVNLKMAKSSNDNTELYTLLQHNANDKDLIGLQCVDSDPTYHRHCKPLLFAPNNVL